MKTTHLEDYNIINKAFKMKQQNMLVSDISKKLSEETGQKITQIALWRAFNNLKDDKQKELLESDYPSLADIVYIFNTKFQKEKDGTLLKYHETTIRRKVMLSILHHFHNKNFTYTEVKIKCNDRDDEQNFLDHWSYLINHNYIENVNDIEFKFCDRVKKWKAGFF